MDWWQALLLGIIEGITEYLPVSSTGHLLVAQRLMGIEKSEAANAFAIAIQAGAIVAVIGLYRQRCASMLRGVAGRDPGGARLAARLMVAFLPAAALGFFLDELIEQHLFGPWPIVAAWAVGGVILLVFPTRPDRAWSTERADLTDLSLQAALIIGWAQCAALWPGTSRSLATILGGLVAGLSLRASVEFSFLLGLITLGGATAYMCYRSGGAMLDSYGAAALAIGFVAALVSAVLAVRWLVSWLTRHGLAFFGWWRLAAAVIVGGLVLGGAL